jgi:hypothetical protein
MVVREEHELQVSVLFFWVVTTCGLTGGYRRFGGTTVSIFNLETLVSAYNPHGVTTHKNNDIFTTVRASNLA